MSYFLLKSEPTTYSIDHLKRDKKTPWSGVRNYQARNIMKNEMKVGDKVLFYHSSCTPPHIAGLAKVASKPYPDPTQFDPESDYYDPKSSQEKPIWWLVDIAFAKKAKKMLTLDEVKNNSKLKNMLLIQRSRLSVQPVSQKDYEHIEQLIT